MEPLGIRLVPPGAAAVVRPARTLARGVLDSVNAPALAATLVWAGNKTALKIALGELDPMVVGTLRLALAGGVLLLVVALRQGSPWLPWRAWPRMLAVGGLGIGLNAILFLAGLSLTSVSNAALISTLSPVFCMAMAVALGQERLAAHRVAGMLLALLGVGLLIRADAGAPGQDYRGGLLLVAAAVAWAAYSVLGAKLLRAHGPIKTTAYSLLTGAVTMALASPLMVHRWDLEHVSLAAWGGLLYAALIASVFGLTLWGLGIKRVGATGTMVYTYLSPVLAIASAAALLGERLTLVQVIGGAIVLAGLALSASARPG
ncbi:MAG: DMT family transporter [Chloroflexi bacterium]|nr:DMT family transporter [Chloroflexota bacterium]